MDENKNKTSAKKLATNARYLGTLDNIMLRVPKGQRDRIRECADKAGESVNAYIVRAIRERMEREEVSE